MSFLVRIYSSGLFLAGLGIGNRLVTGPMSWTKFESYAIHFCEFEEAQATIQFIGDVLDFELAEDLEVVPAVN